MTRSSAGVAVWSKLPVLVRAPLLGIGVTIAASVPWSLLVALNVQTTPRVPWSIAPMAVILWGFWSYTRGKGWPARTAELRSRYSRVRRLNADTWRRSLVAGLLGVAALWMLFWALRNLVQIPRATSGDLTRFSLATIVGIIVMGAAVAAISEETGFRGYMQEPLERRYGPTKAIVLVSGLFSLAHFTHGWQTMMWMGAFYFGAGFVYGWMAYFSGSVLPSTVLHFVGDAVLYGIQVWGAAAAAWAPSPTRALLYAVVGLVLAGASVVAFRRLGTTTRPTATAPASPRRS